MDFRILGRLEVSDGARPVPLRGRKQRALLAFLLLHAGEWVSSDVLVDALWGEEAPRTARASLQNHVAQLRHMLAPGILVSGNGGYELAVSDEQIDLGRFERLAGEARSRDGQRRVEKLREALELWRGPPLADLAYEPFASHEAVRLEELRVTALEDLIDAKLALGAGPELVESLETLVTEQPFRERFRAQLMLALYRSGRQVEALEVYQQTRRTLLEELGIEPGTTLRELEQAILRQDDSLEPPPLPSPEQAQPLEKRRKLVTVLFADITYAETLDPELLRETSVSVLKAMRAALVRHGAQIEQRTSGEVMAVFGIPQAHEDDGLRAARAARELQTEIDSAGGQPFELRIGIESGEVLAGVDAAGHGFVSGAVVTQAKRLLEHADPGEALAGATTLRLLGDAAISEPKRNGLEFAAAIVELADRAAPPAGRLPEPALVGRATELRALHAAFARVVDSRASELFLLIGEAGIGKTRLARELTAQLDGSATIVQGRCLSYGQTLTYWPLVEALRTLDDPASPALELLVSGGATSPHQLAWSVQQALEQAAQERPLLVLLEDLHWAEPALLDLLDLVAELSSDVPIMLLGLARPELLEQRPDWAQTANSLVLEPLDHADSESLLSQLQRPPQPKTRERALELAAGNPLFLEELSAFLAEGGDDSQLPPRIQILLQARLDLLPEAERHLLVTAAVEGTIFHRGALEALLPDERRPELPTQLAALTGGLLIRPAHPQLEGEQAFRFHHQLIRDTAYNALPKSDRARLHAQFADWLERRSGERTELDDIAAYHLEQAALCRRDLGSGEPAFESRAAAALAAAGGRAWRRTDFAAAANLWPRALALLDDDDPSVPELELELALALTRLGGLEQARQLLEHAGRQTADPCVAAAVRLAGLYALLHRAPEGIPAAIRRECAEAIPLFERRADHRQLARAWYTLALAEMAELQVQAAAQAWESAAAEAQLANDRAFEMWIRAESTERIGIERMPSTATIRELEQLEAQFPGEPTIQSTLGIWRAYAAFQTGRREQARTLLREALAVSRRAGATVVTALHTAGFGWIELLGGDLDEAEGLALAGIRELQEYNEHLWLSWVLALLADIRTAQGRPAEALELADEAEQHGRHDRRNLITATSSRARAHVHLDAIEEAQAGARAAVAVAETTDSLLQQAHAQYALAEVLAAAEEFAAALAAAEVAGRLYTTLERPLHIRRATTLAEQIERGMTRVGAPTPAA